MHINSMDRRALVLYIRDGIDIPSLSMAEVRREENAYMENVAGIVGMGESRQRLLTET